MSSSLVKRLLSGKVALYNILAKVFLAEMTLVSEILVLAEVILVSEILAAKSKSVRSYKRSYTALCSSLKSLR